MKPKKQIPLLPLPYGPLSKLSHGFYPLSSFLLKVLPSMEMELEGAKSQFDGKEYISGALLTFTIYFIGIGAILVTWAFRNELIDDLKIRLAIFSISFIISLAIFMYILAYPKWKSSKVKLEVEKNLLFAARHLMIQTNAGVPLFDSIVSISEEYDDENLNYGAISKEFRKIVREVKSGKELTVALEESAVRNPSQYYKRAIWQLANANRAGANMGFVLKDIVEYLSSEQRIMIRNYGSQLNPLALFYMFTCIIAPTMGIIFLAIIVTIAGTPINDFVFITILVLLAIAQIVFIGLIKSRRPTVAL
jgi:pilus assembly protein TadC